MLHKLASDISISVPYWSCSPFQRLNTTSKEKNFQVYYYYYYGIWQRNNSKRNHFRTTSPVRWSVFVLKCPATKCPALNSLHTIFSRVWPDHLDRQTSPLWAWCISNQLPGQDELFSDKHTTGKVKRIIRKPPPYLSPLSAAILANVQVPTPLPYQKCEMAVP